MSAAKHTPGPWELCLGDEGRSSEIFVLREDDDQVLIADVHSHVFGREHADARLIAAAPELLQALQDLEYAVEGLEYVQKEYAAEVQKARAAIAKATRQKGGAL